MKTNIYFDNDNVSYYEEKIFRDNYYLNPSVKIKTLGPNYNKFKRIDLEQKEKIKSLAINFYNTLECKSRYEKYENIVKYLSTLYGKEKIVQTRKSYTTIVPEYDELLTFIIEACDPECKSFITYYSCDNKISQSNKASMVRKEVGFYSDRLVLAEKEYYLKFINNLLTDIKVDYSKYINLIINSISSFDSITDERYEQICKSSTEWSFLVNPEVKYTTCLFNILYQPNLLNLNSVSEKMVFLIESVDPDLKLLEIYEDGCLINNINEESIKELGFFNKYMIRLEKLYEQRFKKTSKTKKWTK